MQNKEQSFDDLLNAVLKTWDEGGVSAVENQFALEGEYKEIYDNICKCIDRNKEKYDQLQEYKAKGGTTEGYISKEMYRAFEATNATDEQKAKVLNDVTDTMRGVTKKDFEETNINEDSKTENAPINEPKIEAPNEDNVEYKDGGSL